MLKCSVNNQRVPRLNKSGFYRRHVGVAAAAVLILRGRRPLMRDLSYVEQRFKIKFGD